VAEELRLQPPTAPEPHRLLIGRGRVARPEDELRAVGLAHKRNHLLVDVEVEPCRKVAHDNRVAAPASEAPSPALDQEPHRLGPGGRASVLLDLLAAALPDPRARSEAFPLALDALGDLRLAALNRLLELGLRATSSYLERPAEAEFTQRKHAIREAKQRQELERQERRLGIDY